MKYILVLLIFFIPSCGKVEQTRHMDEFTEVQFEVDTPVGHISGKLQAKRTQDETTITIIKFQPPSWQALAGSGVGLMMGGTGVAAGVMGLAASMYFRRKRETDGHAYEKQLQEQLADSERQTKEICTGISLFMRNNPDVEKELRIALKGPMSTDTRDLVRKLT